MSGESKADFLVVGAGIIGLSLARELRKREPRARILVVEKEPDIGMHASGRNSGVLHSGIFYPDDSLKAGVCVEGGRAMAEYCDARRLPIARTGKVILPIHESDDARLRLLCEKGKSRGIRASLVDAEALKTIEPRAVSLTGNAVHLPDVAVVDPVAVLRQIATDLAAEAVEIRFNAPVTAADPAGGVVQAGAERIAFGHLFNAAGLHADAIARLFGIGHKYRIMPFKGLYYRIASDFGIGINGLIYALPDPAVPFLGIHFMRKVNGDVLAGPTIIPAFGRENYHGLSGLSPGEAGGILFRLSRLYLANHQGFRNLVRKEGFRFLKSMFYRGARRLVPDLKIGDLLPSDKVGIRAQLVNLEKEELVMDFLVEQGPRSTHVLNAVSPAFTSAFAFAGLVLDRPGAA